MAYDANLSAVILFGGQDTSGNALGDTWEFVNQKWVDLTANLSTAPAARWAPGLIYDPQVGGLLLFGGRDFAGAFNDTWTFNASGWHLLNLSGAPAPRGVGMNLVYDGADGYAILIGSPFGSSYPEVWSFANTTWSNITSLQVGSLPKLGFKGVYDAADGYTVFVGGDTGCTGYGLTWTYKADRWTNLTATAGAPTAMMGSNALTYDENLSAVVMFGGYTAACTVTSETWALVNGSWSDLSFPSPNPPGVWDGRLAYDAAAGADVLVGGNGAFFGGSNVFVNDTWELMSGSVAPGSAFISPIRGSAPLNVTFRVSLTAVDRAPISVIWSFGDGSPNSTMESTTHLYSRPGTYTSTILLRDASGRTLTGSASISVYPAPKGVWLNLIASGSTVTTPTPRQAFTMEYDPPLGEAVLFGGQDSGGNALSDTWAFAGNAWTQLSTSASPSARWGAAMVYDPAQGGLVLFGGRDQNLNYFNDTWLFNASGWTNITPTTSPSPSPRNVDGRMVYDAGDGYVLLGGGGSLLTGADQDTWTFSGGKWTNLTSKVTGSPPTYGFQGAYDAADGYALFYGGTGYCAGPSATWTYHGRVWKDITSTAGSPTQAAGAAGITYDPIEKGVLMNSGYDNSCSVTNQTWLFQNGTWEDLTNLSGTNPPGRWDARMTFDPILAGDLVWGGNENPFGGSNSFYGDTWDYHDGLNVSARTNVSIGIAPLTVTLSSGSVTGGTSPYYYNWTFGDGSPNSTGTSASHTYASPGSYTATLVVNDSSGRFGVAQVGVSVYADVAVDAQSNPTFGEAPLTVAFSANGSGGVPPIRYHWDFGDGNASVLRGTSHTYETGGNFTWTLTMSDSQGHSVSRNGTISVIPTLSVAIASATARGEMPLNVTFNSTLTGGRGPFVYNWSFGDGSFGPDASSTRHTYTSVGAYTAWVNVTDSLGLRRGAHLSVVVVSRLAAGAAVSALRGEVPFADQFQADPSGGIGPYTVVWSFGDGSPTANGTFLTHTYQTPGTYTATASVVDSFNDTSSQSFSITVDSPLAASLGALPPDGTVPFTVNFTASVGGSATPMSYLWKFGDGSGSTLGPSVGHTYRAAGNFTASVTVTDADGRSVVSSVSVLVVPREAVLLTSNLSSVVVGESVGLSASATGGFPSYTYSWSGLPPGCLSANESTLTCVPRTPGNYSIEVVTTDSHGDSANSTLALLVLAPVVPSSGGGASTSSLLLIAGIVIVVVAVAVGVIVWRRRRPAPPYPPEEPAAEFGAAGEDESSYETPP